jgi:hypothetical protein
MTEEIYSSTGITDAPPTPEQAAQVEAGRAKLIEMTGGAPASKPRPTGPPAHVPSARRRATDDLPPGRTFSSPDAAALRASQSQASPAAQRIKELNHPDSPLWKTGTAEGDAARDELRRLLAQEATLEEKQAIADAPIGQLRDQFSINHDQVLKPIQDKWDEHEEGTVLATFAQQGVSPEAVTAIMDWYTGIFNGALGNAANINADEIETQFRALAKRHGVADDVVEALVEHHKGRLT